METCPFKSAEELSLSQRIYSGYVRLLPLLEEGKIEYEDVALIDMKRMKAEREAPTTLNMRYIRCGTAGCLIGWAKVLGDPEPNDREINVEATRNHQNLIMPDGYRSNPAQFTVKRCAKALRAYLTTGRPDWS